MRRPRAFSIGICLILAALVAGCAGDRMSRSTEETVDDSLLANKVKIALYADKQVSGRQIAVEASQGVIQLRRFLKKNILNSGGWCRVDQNVVLGQCRMALQSFFNRLHRRLPERNALLVDFVAELDDRMQPLPGHPLGPL